MMATVPHVISGLGLRKFQADGFLLTRVYIAASVHVTSNMHCPREELDYGSTARGKSLRPILTSRSL